VRRGPGSEEVSSTADRVTHHAEQRQNRADHHYDDADRPDNSDVREELCVPITSSTSCHQAIFVDQAADLSLSSDAVLAEVDRLG
jgi:hypothetical protein